MAVLLIVAAVIVVATREGHRPARAAFVAAPTPQPAPEPTPGFAFSAAAATVPPPMTGSAWVPPTPPVYATVQRGPRLNRALISAAVLAAGVYLLIGQAGAYQPLALQATAVALTTLGVGLAVTAWRARSRGALVLGILLSVVVMVGSVIEGDYGSAIGKRVWRPADAHSIAAEYRLALGDGTLDLTQVAGQLPGRTIDVTMGAGKLTVLLPQQTSVQAIGDIGVGNFSLDDDRWDGPVTETVTTPGWTASTGLRLRLHLRAGNIEVSHD